jgi:cytidylate kinase
MAVITISRQLGTHGARIAKSLAGELGYDLVDKAVVNRVIRQYGLTKLNAVYDHKPTFWQLFNDDSAATIRMMNTTIAAVAARGNVVILGRGGSRVLRGMADVLNVFVKASDDVRAERIAKRDNISTREAARVIKDDDALRARFTRLFYSADWADESQFDLVVDTGLDSDEAAKARIKEAAAVLKLTGERTAASITVDGVLARTVHDVLARRTARTV